MGDVRARAPTRAPPRTPPDVRHDARDRAHVGSAPCSSPSRFAPAARAGCRRRSAPRSALAMLGDVVEAAARRRPNVAGRDRRCGRPPRRSRARRAEVVDDPGGGQGAAVAAALADVDGALPRRERRSSARPAVGSRRARRATAPRPGRGRRGRRRDDERARVAAAEVFQPLYGPGSAAQFRAHAVALELPFEDLALPNLVDDVDTLARPRAGRRPGRVHATRSLLEAIAPVKVVCLSGGVGGAKLAAGLHDVTRAGGADGDRQRRRRRRGARPARLARPRLDPVRPRRLERRGTRLGARRRELADARVGEGVGRRELVHARRSRPRAPSRPHAGTSRRRSRCRP